MADSDSDDLADYYSNLLILQFRGLPKATGLVEAVVSPVIMNSLPTAVMNAYNLNGSMAAVGPQLDVIGKYVGVSRTGVDLNGNNIKLADADYLQLIKLVIIKNNSGSDLGTIQKLLAATFPGQIFINDTTTMQINYTIVETIGTSQLLALLVTGNYLPRPMGVSMSVTTIASHTNPFFGFRNYSDQPTGIAPFNNYLNYQMTYPWFTYGLSV